MRIFWTFFWVVLLVLMLTYVVSSMLGTPFVLMNGFILSVITTIFILILSSIIPDEPAGKEELH